MSFRTLSFHTGVVFRFNDLQKRLNSFPIVYLFTKFVMTGTVCENILASVDRDLPGTGELDGYIKGLKQLINIFRAHGV